MPSFDLESAVKKSSIDSFQKSITYAHSFEVQLTPQNSGDWYTTDSYRVWNLEICSEGALSLNLIFSKYYLPQGARLFIYGPDKEFLIGAFTARNNKPFKKLATYPIPGDTVIVQYEEPLDAEFNAELEIGKVNHDYIGIVPLKNRWTQRVSGECNIDVNCENNSGLDNEQRAVCRIIADDELGTATLINKVSDDGNPYLISAYHVFDNTENAEITLFDFNYESPFCTAIDGFDSQSISGSTTLASFDSLDFMLVELSEMPPAEYRPYLAGWDASSSLPSNSHIIHHPNGDVKKITYDEGVCDSFSFSRSYVSYGHWKVYNWETGTTEGGSSGGALLNADRHVVGTLTGGYASCTNLSYDAFVRFDKMWNYRSESAKQLKSWLDPSNNGDLIVDGSDPYESDGLNCIVISNYLMDDELMVLDQFDQSGNVTEVAERFDQTEVSQLSGVGIGISDYTATSFDPEVVIRVYTGDDTPDFAVMQYEFPMSDLTPNAMNYFDFGESLRLLGNFYIGVLLYDNEDTLSLFRSDDRVDESLNTMLVKEDGVWINASDLDDNSVATSLLIQANVCSVELVQEIDTLDDQECFMSYYPNPASTYVYVEFNESDEENELTIYDLTGRLMYSECYENEYYVQINIAFLTPGIYVMNLSNSLCSETNRLLVTGN
jgi:hypothetical protein